MTSKLVLNHQKSSQSVSAAIKTHAPNIVTALEQKLAGLLREGETMPNIAGFLSLLDRLCLQSLDTLTSADQHLETERLEDTDARSARQSATDALYALMTGLSDDIAYIYGGAILAKYHLSGTTPTDPTTLTEQATRTAEALSNVALPAPRRTNATFDPQAAAQTLRAQVKQTRQALASVASESRETEQALLTRDNAAQTHNITFTRTATIFEQLCELAGESGLADRVRRTAAKPGRTVEDLDLSSEPPAPSAQALTPDAPSDDPNP